MTKNVNDEIAGERALSEGQADRLGFSDVAKRIANSIVDRAAVEGLVIGLEGEWGSGKSSLLHLIERSLAQLPNEKRPTIINFRPWLVGNRDALLASLFGELAEKIAQVHLSRGDTTSATNKKAKRAAAAVRKFAYALSKTGEIVEVAGAFWKPFEIIGRLLRSINAISKEEEKITDLAGLKSEIVKDLRDLNHRFIITVDDVDRLEPPEVIEVLRLVRSVADFPNIVYLLCYDAGRLGEAIESGARIKNGAAYLEKIIQLTVMIPKPEPFELRHWFDEEVVGLLGLIPDEVRERLKMVIDHEGGRQLRTPRSVVRTLDSLRFFWPAIRDEKIDVADLVWLQLVKDGSPKLYRWVETYVANAAATSFGTAIETEISQADRLEELLAIMDQNQLKDDVRRFIFSDILPGFEASYDNGGPPVKIHQQVNANDRQNAIQGRRLASPDHYRLYFSLIGPTHSITQAAFDVFWAAVDGSPAKTAEVILDLHGQMALGSLRKSDILFERLHATGGTAWTALRAKNLLLALGDMMDDAYRLESNEKNFIVTNWDRAERIFPILYSKIADSDQEILNKQLFGNGRAVGWLTSILRRETFAHGLFGSRLRPAEDWYLPEVEFSKICSIMMERYRAMSIKEILETPRPNQIFYAWNQIGDEYGPRNLIKSSIITDNGFIDVLDALTSSIESSGRGRYVVLNRENIEMFLDYDAMRDRLTSIAHDGPSSLKERAVRLIRAADDATDF